jgi:hypothetical protein
MAKRAWEIVAVVGQPHPSPRLNIPTIDQSLRINFQPHDAY